MLARPVSYVAPDMFAPNCEAWPFGGLVPQAYDLIMIDPPWQFELYSAKGEEKSAQAHYETMSLAAIAALPVADLAGPDCLVWLWATAPMLDKQLDVLKGWGFRFVTSGVWVKTTVNDKIAFGTGYVLRNAHEPFLIGALGEPKTARCVRSVVMGRTREHSRKPDSAYAAAERLIPEGPAGGGRKIRRADLFSRERRPGWESWGNQVGKFTSVAPSDAHTASGARTGMEQSEEGTTDGQG